MPSTTSPLLNADHTRVSAGWREAVQAVWLPFLITRLLLFVVGIYALSIFPLNPGVPVPAIDVSLPLRIWARWDTVWYLDILQHGYQYTPGHEANVAFFPLYPLLVGIGAFVFGQNHPTGWMISGILLSHVTLFVALLLLYLLAREQGLTASAARRACLYLCVFPVSLFFSAMYPMALGLLLYLGAFYAARRRLWWLAGVFAGLAGATRMEGVLLLPALLLEWWLQQREARLAGRPIAYSALPALLLPALAPFVCWCAYLWYRFNDPFVFRTVQNYWAGASRGYFGKDSPARALVDYSFLAMNIVGTILCWREHRIRPSYALHASMYVLLVLGLAVSQSHSFASSPRYGLNLFPLFWVLALYGRRPGIHLTYLILAPALLTLFMLLFALNYWVA